jgi:hypothetical protein
MLCCARTQASMPFKCSTPGCVSSANGGTRNLGGISLSRLLATSQRTLPQSENFCHPLVSRSAEAFALTRVLIDLAILSGSRAQDGDPRVLPSALSLRTPRLLVSRAPVSPNTSIRAWLIAAPPFSTMNSTQPAPDRSENDWTSAGNRASLSCQRLFRDPAPPAFAPVHLFFVW